MRGGPRRRPVRGYTLGAMSGPGDAGEREDVAGVVRDQIDALRAGQWERAYAHAARGIAARLGLEGFRRMVEEGYAPLVDAAAARVESVDVEGDAATARVSLMAPDGGLVGARYELVREEGAWRVSGVVLGASLTAVMSLNGHARGRRSGE